MKIEGIDIRYIPFSTYGSYMAINYLTEDYYSGYVSCTGFSTNLDKMPFVSTPGLYMRSVATKGQNNNMEMCRFEPTIDGNTVEYSIKSDYSRVDILFEKGEISLCFADESTILIQGEGERIGLNINAVIEGRPMFSVPVKCKEGLYYKITNHVSFDRYGLFIKEGEIELDQEWEPDHLLNTKCVFKLSTRNNKFSAVIKELRSYVWNEDKRGYDFKKAEEVSRDRIRTLFAKIPSSHDRYKEAVRQAVYLAWSAVVSPRGYLKRDSMFMTKNILCFVWAYESWLCAAGFWPIDQKIAWDQLMTMFDSQEPLGGLPNFKGDGMESFEANMPPNFGWIVMKMMEKASFSNSQLEEIYEKMNRYTNFYINHMDSLGLNLYEYHHGYDACADDDTVFRDALNIISPDLTTFLILQMDALAQIAGILHRDTEKAEWSERSSRSLQALMDNLFDENNLPFALNTITGERIYARSPILFTPLMLGKRLSKEIRDAIINELKSKNYITQFGLASESLDSKYYQPEGFFRGPIWFTMTLTTIEGLIQCGEKDLAMELVVRYCDLVREGGCAECYNAQTGAPLNNRGYTSTAGTFLILLNYYFDN